MTKVVLVHPDIYAGKNEQLLASFASDVKVIPYTTAMTADDLTTAVAGVSVSHLAFLYHYPGYARLPFFDTFRIIDNKPNLGKYAFMSDTIIDIFKLLKVNGLTTVDILSCSLSDPKYKEEIALIETDCNIDIRFSTDKTGSISEGANWVMESELPTVVNVRELYFTDAVLEWTGVLESDIATAIKAGGAFAQYISWNPTTKIFTLLRNFNFADFINTTGINSFDFIGLNGDEIFDGNNKVIDMNFTELWRGLFVAYNENPGIRATVRNLTMINGGGLDVYGGYIMRNSQRYFNIDKCYVAGNILNLCAGGIAGSRSGYFYGICSITNSYHIGDIIGNYSGGIVGFQAAWFGPGKQAGPGYGTIVIENCYHRGVISGAEAGGICGPSAGDAGGRAYISNCNNTGDITGFAAGGIIGRWGGQGNGLVNISKCYNTGAVVGQNAGGIVGMNAGANDGQVDLFDCYNTGAISNLAGGIVGSHASNTYNAGTVGAVSVTNCYNSGTVTGSSGGILANSARMEGNGTCILTNCVSNGLLISPTRGTTISVNSSSENLATINNTIYPGWTGSTWAVGDSVEVNVTGTIYSYRLPILNVFKSAPWNTNSYVSATTGAVFVVLVTPSGTPVIVNFNVNIDTDGTVNVFTQGVVNLQNQVLPTMHLPVSVLYNGPGNGLIKFQGVNDNIVATRDTFTTTENTIRDALHSVITSALNAINAAPYNTMIGGVRKYTDTSHYIVPNLGSLALGAYAHYLFGHVQATAAIDNDTTFINYMNGIVAGTAQIPNGLATQIKTINDTKSLAIAKQVIGQDASRAVNVDNDINTPSTWQTLEFRPGDAVFFAVVLKTPSVTVAGGTPYSSDMINPSNYIETTYYIKCLLE